MCSTQWHTELHTAYRHTAYCHTVRRMLYTVRRMLYTVRRMPCTRACVGTEPSETLEGQLVQV